MKTFLFSRRAAWIALALLGSSAALANVTLAPLFRDGAVLQRDQPLPIFGRATAGEKIRVQFHAQFAETTAAADGSWRVTLSPEPADGNAAELIAAGANVVRVHEVVVGDVWLCSGQSNMEFRVAQANDAGREIAAANFPLIRQFKVAHLVSDKPAVDAPGAWKPCTPATAGEFTAAGFFFARDLFQRTGVPIGLVNSSWGGTQIEGWIGADALAADPAAPAIVARWQKVLADYPAKVAAQAKALAQWKSAAAAAKAAGQPVARRQPAAAEGPGSRWMPSGMFNAMIAPLTPAALRGVLWYQGEANAARAGEYRTLFPAMIQQWRVAFAQPRLPFYFVQLPNFERGDAAGEPWARLREAQAGALALPDTGMAVAIDIGDPQNIHPKNKQEIGRRLALLARAQIFGEQVESAGPTLVSAKPEGAALRVTFSHAAGLTLRDQPLTGVEVAGDDRKFVPATARIEGDDIVVAAGSVKAPVAVRYAWRNCPVASLFNGVGLPAAPFRSDNW
jgi:sialate O-acetylesterase